MKTSSIILPGCCVTKYFYNIGTAHGHPAAKNLEQFAYSLIDQGIGKINFTFTNANQVNERDYLDKLGFRVNFKNDRVHQHICEKEELEKFLKPYMEERQRQLIKKNKEEYEKLQVLQKKLLMETPIPVNLPVTYTKVEALIRRFNTLKTGDVIKRFYNVTLPNDLYDQNFNACRAISAFIRKSRKNEE